MSVARPNLLKRALSRLTALTSVSRGMEKPTMECDEDALFEALSNSRRRHAVMVVAEKGAMDLSELVTEIAALECDCDPAGLSSSERKRVQTALYQSHLEKLEAAGVVVTDWSGHGTTVVPGSGLGEAVRVIDSVREVTTA